MFLDSFFNTENTRIIDIQRVQQITVKGVLQPKEWFSVKQVECLFYRGSMSDKFVSQRNQVDISAIALVSPSDITSEEIPSNGRIIIKTGAEVEPMYSIIMPDNIAEQDELIVIQLKAYT